MKASACETVIKPGFKITACLFLSMACTKWEMCRPVPVSPSAHRQHSRFLRGLAGRHHPVHNPATEKTHCHARARCRIGLAAFHSGKQAFPRILFRPYGSITCGIHLPPGPAAFQFLPPASHNPDQHQGYG